MSNGKGNTRMTSDRGTNARGTSNVSRVTIRPIREGLPNDARLARIVDLAQAANRSIYFAPITDDTTNSHLIAEAKRLDIILWKNDINVGPQEKSVIAKRLLEICDEVERRIKKAAADQQKIVPVIEGIEWAKDDVLAPLIESVSPFQMASLWQQFIIPSAKPARARPAKKRPKPSEPESPEPEKPSQVQLRPERKPSIQEAIRRARRALLKKGVKRPSDFYGEKWYRCVLRKAEDPSANMWYMTANNMLALLIDYKSELGKVKTKIENDALVIASKYGTYQLTASQRALLDQVESEWARKLVYPEEFRKTKHWRDLLALRLTRSLVDPWMRRYWRRYDQDARRDIVKIVHEAGNDDARILVKLANLRGEINYAVRWYMSNIFSRQANAGLPIELIRIMWERLKGDRNSFLYCRYKWGVE